MAGGEDIPALAARAIWLEIPEGLKEKTLLQLLEPIGEIEHLEFTERNKALCLFKEPRDVEKALKADSLKAAFCVPSSVKPEDYPEKLAPDIRDTELGDQKPPTLPPQPDLMAQLVDLLRANAQVAAPSPPVQPVPPGGMGYRLVEQVTKLSMFSGTSKDASFETWEYEVKCLVRENLEADMIKSAIRRSLKGDAARVLLNLGETPTVDQILTKFRGIYGQVQTGALLLQSYWSEKQKDDESVSNWGCRLEDLMQQLKEKKQVNQTDTEKMLCTKFWSGLRSSKLKDATRYKYETVDNFDQLRMEVRCVEQEYAEEKAATKARSHVTTTDTSTSSQPSNDLVQQLLKRIDELEGLVKSGMTSNHPQYNLKTSMKAQRQAARQPQTSNNTRSSTDDAKHYGKNDQGVYICNRCFQEGHISKGCKTDLTTLKDHLNVTRPAPQGSKK